MPTYIAMLRGINVGGQKSIKMELLRKSFEALKFKDVKTYVQSGNVIFKGPTKSPDSLSKLIEKRILKGFGFSVPVLVKTSQEMGQTVQSNPFVRVKKIDSSKLYVTFLFEKPQRALLAKLDELDQSTDQLSYSGKEIYLYCPNGYGVTKLSNTAFEKKLAVTATARNWNTVNALYEMSLD